MQMFREGATPISLGDLESSKSFADLQGIAKGLKAEEDKEFDKKRESRVDAAKEAETQETMGDVYRGLAQSVNVGKFLGAPVSTLGRDFFSGMAAMSDILAEGSKQESETVDIKKDTESADQTLSAIEDYLSTPAEGKMDTRLPRNPSLTQPMQATKIGGFKMDKKEKEKKEKKIGFGGM